MDDLMNQAEPRTLLLGLGVIVLLVCALQVLYVLWPQFKQFNELSESHRILVGAASGEDGLLQELDQTRAEVERLQHRLHGDMAGLPAQQMESYIIGRLQKVSWDTDVELISVQPSVGQQVQNFQERLFEIQIHARYYDFFAWLRQIGRELGFIVVKKYRIHPQDQALADPVLGIRLTMVSYRMMSE